MVFDQKLIDMWEAGTGHLCSNAYVHPGIGYHIAMTSGLISSEGFKAADFSVFKQHWAWNTSIYATEYQRTWDEAFINSPLKVKSIVPTYDVHYLDTDGIVRNFCDAPDIIVPVQPGLKKRELILQLEGIGREVALDRHRQRLTEDALYRAKWGKE